MTSHPTRRSVTRAGAWSAPAIVLATAAPARAASGTPAKPIKTRTEGPTLFAQSDGTIWLLWVTNNGTVPLTSRTIKMSLRVGDPTWDFQGFGGQNWDYDSPISDSSGLRFVFLGNLPVGTESSPCYVIMKRKDRAAAPVPTTTLTITAPGFDVTVLPLSIPF